MRTETKIALGVRILSLGKPPVAVQMMEKMPQAMASLAGWWRRSIVDSGLCFLKRRHHCAHVGAGTTTGADGRAKKTEISAPTVNERQDSCCEQKRGRQSLAGACARMIAQHRYMQ